MRSFICALLALSASAAPPSFVTVLPDDLLAIDPVTGVVTYGIQASDLDGDSVTLSASSSHPGVQAIVSSSNRYARLNVVASDGSPIGPIVFEIFETRGGEAASRFITHATSNPDGPDTWYTDSPFHRVAELPGLILQAGHSAAGSTGSSLGSFADQFELQDGLNFAQKGVVAMANSGPNTNNSQFFITDGATTHLDGVHMIFGQVISGQSVITTIGNLSRDGNSRPQPTPRIASVDILDQVNGGALTIRVLPGFAGSADVTVTLEDETGASTEHRIQVHVPMTVHAEIAAPGGTTFHAVRDANGILYVANGARGLDIWDSTVPGDPQFIRNLDTAGSARHVTLASTSNPPRTIALVADSDNGLIIYDVSNPELATQLDHVPVTAGAGNLDGSTYLSEVQNGIAYVAEGTGGFSSFDISDPSNVVGPLGSLDLLLTANDNSQVPANVVALALNGNTAYASLQNFGVIAIDISNPASLLLAGNQGFGSAWGMAFENNRLYVTEVAGNGALRVYDMTSPRTFQNLLGTHPLVGFPWQVDAHGDLVIVAHSPVPPSFPTGGFSVLDISDPAGIGTHFFHSSNSAVQPTIAEDFVLVPIAGEGLLFSDLRVLSQPEISLAIDGEFLTDGALIDFGQLDEGGTPRERSLRIYNDGAAILTLGAILLPAGYSHIGSPPPTLLPGTWADIVLRLNTDAVGAFAGDLALHSDDPSENPIRLALTGDVVGAASISGHVHTNASGTPPLPDIEMTLTPIVGGSTPNPVTTNAEGNFTFANLVSGTYRLTPALPSNYQNAIPTERLITLNPLNTISDANFAMVPKPASIAGFIWDDADADGIIDDSESPLPNISVSLAIDGGVVQTQTNDEGRYSFAGLSAGTYTLSAAAIPGKAAATRPNPRNITLDWGDSVQFADFNYFTPPVLSIVEATSPEEVGRLDIAVSLSFDIGIPVVAEFATLAGSGLPDQDYRPVSGTLTIPARATSGSISVPILDDGIAEFAETFQVTITSIQNATTGGSANITITDTDRPRFRIQANDPLVTEGAGPGTVTIQRIGVLAAPMTVDLALSGSADSADYAAIPTTLTFSTSDTEQLIDIDAIADGIAEGLETLTLTLQRRPDHVILADSAIVSIADSDTIDLAIAINHSAESRAAGAPVTLALTASNLSDKAIINPIQLAVHLSQDDSFGNEDDIPLQAFPAPLQLPGLDASTALPLSPTLWIPIATPVGSYRLIARIDSAESFSESDETNNSAATDAIISVADDARAWRFPLTVSGASESELRIGMVPGATDGSDPYDITLISRAGSAQLARGGDRYLQDIRPLANSASWTLLLTADSEDLVVSWDPAAMPTDRGLYLQDDSSGETRYFMQLTEIRVPVGNSASYSIRVVDTVETDLTVTRGWNLLSFPLAPLRPAPATVLGAGVGPVQHWRNGAWERTDTLTALDGIWAFARRSHSATVRGMPAHSEIIDLAPGWHAIGPISAIPASALDIDIVWGWTGRHFTIVDHLLPGHGYLIYTQTGTQLNFGP
jgi:peptidyl-prolyl cis-trans isomerase A (cyclophilin A)